MFATPTSYCVTPSRKPFMRIPERASTFLRDVKRRSLRVKRSKSLIDRHPECKLSGSFVQLNEEEVRQKYIDDVRLEREWKREEWRTEEAARYTRAKYGQQEEEEEESVLHSTALEMSTPCSCSCRLHQLHQGATTTTTPRPGPFLPPSPASTICTPPPAAHQHHALLLARSASTRRQRDIVAVSGDSSAPDGQFRKLDSPTLQDMIAAENNKENMTPSNPLPPPAFTPLSRRRCSRRSSIFTPSFKKQATSTGTQSSIGTSTLQAGGEINKKARKLGDGEIGSGSGGTTGQGRIIPLKQGYLYKKSGSSRIYRRKYVTLCSDGTITYYPSFQAYVDMVHGKEIRLQHVTVKIPGQKPTGLRSAQVSLDRLGAAAASEDDSSKATTTNSMTVNNNNNCADPLMVSSSSGSSSSSDEYEKEVVTYEHCQKSTSATLTTKAVAVDVVNNGGKTPKRKRHRLSDESSAAPPMSASAHVSGDTALTAASSSSHSSSMFELVIVSLESRQWQFQLCSQEEGEEWVAAIQQQIHTSLKAGSCHQHLATASRSSWWQQQAGGDTSSSTVAIDSLRHLAGNEACADCGAASPAWASLNLGTLICIECSGIHRQLGSHITKVRSLDLDSWSECHLALLRAVGNSLANSVWEAELDRQLKPGSCSTREAKESFIKSKYLSKSFAVVHSKERVNTESLVSAIQSEDMRLFLENLIHGDEAVLTGSCSGGLTPLQHAINSRNVVFAQLLVWNNADVKLAPSDPIAGAASVPPATAVTQTLGRHLRSGGGGGRRNTEDWQVVFEQMATTPRPIIKESQLL